MIPFQYISPVNNPHYNYYEVLSAINYNFGLLSGGTTGLTANLPFLNLSGGTVTGTTRFSGNGAAEILVIRNPDTYPSGFDSLQIYDGSGIKQLYIDSSNQFAFYAGLNGPLYFGTFANPTAGLGGFSKPGEVINCFSVDTVRMGVGGGGSYFAISEPQALLELRGKADERQLIIQANGTQTTNIFEGRNASESPIVVIDNSWLFRGPEISGTSIYTNGLTAYTLINSYPIELNSTGGALARLGVDGSNRLVIYSTQGFTNFFYGGGAYAQVLGSSYAQFGSDTNNNWNSNAYLNIAGGIGTRPSLNIFSGEGPTTLTNGDIWNDGNFINFYPGVQTNALSANTLSASTYYSGSTPLQLVIQSLISSTDTYVQNGLNTYTGGTPFGPTVNVSALTIDHIAVSGETIFSAGTGATLTLTDNVNGNPDLIIKSIFNQRVLFTDANTNATWFLQTQAFGGGEGYGNIGLGMSSNNANNFFTINTGATVQFKSNQVTGFTITNTTGGTPVFRANTVNKRVGINTAFARESFEVSGSTLVQSLTAATNSLSGIAFVNLTANTPVLSVDTINNRVGVLKGTPAQTLDVGGIINAQHSISQSGGYYINSNRVIEQGPTGYPNAAFVFGGGASTGYNVFNNIPFGIGTSGNSLVLRHLFTIAQSLAGYGSIQTLTGATIITGISTSFLTTFNVGDTIRFGSNTYTISAITSDTSLTLATTAATTSSSSTYFIPGGGDRLYVSGNGNLRSMSNSISGLTVYTQTGTTPVFAVDTKNFRVGINTITPREALDIVGNSILQALTATTISNGSQSMSGARTHLTGTTILSGVVVSSFADTGTTRLVETNSGGTLSATRQIVSAFGLPSSAMTALSLATNWDNNGLYTGTTIDSTYQGQEYYDSAYYYRAVADNYFIRLIRG